MELQLIKVGDVMWLSVRCVNVINGMSMTGVHDILSRMDETEKQQAEIIRNRAEAAAATGAGAASVETDANQQSTSSQSEKEAK